MENLYKIKDKNHNVVDFKPNNAQKLILDSIQNQKPIRNIIIKSRQEGVSTFWLLYWLDETMFNNNMTTGILSHKWESLNHLWNIILFAYRNLPEDLQAPLGEESKRALYFKEIESRIFISLSIRSTGLHNLHISEWCWCNDNEVKATLGACSPSTNISGESTGNGISNDGYETYQDAKLGENEFNPLFLPWYIQDEYKLPLKDMSAKRIMNNLNNDEKRLQKIMLNDWKMELQPEQVLWRRQTIRKVKDLFPQEYPETDDDAFITSGQHFFNVRKIMALLSELKEYTKNNEFYEVTNDYICFEPVDKRDIYIAGADTSEGIHDYCVLKIKNVTKRRDAFVYRARCGIKTFYQICYKWGTYYNNALLAVELNNTGHAVVEGLQTVCRYRNLYYTTNETRLIRKQGDKLKIKFGWETTKITRTLMINDLKYFIEEDEQIDVDNFKPEITIYDENFLKEALTFINNSGKYEAEEGKFDDSVIAEAICMQMYKKVKPFSIIDSKSKTGIIIGEERESSRL